MNDEKYYRDMLAVIDSNIASGKLNDLQMENAVEDRLFFTAELQVCLTKKNKLDPAGLERAAKRVAATLCGLVQPDPRDESQKTFIRNITEEIIRAYLGTEGEDNG